VTTTIETAAAGDVAEPDGAPAPWDAAAAERQTPIERWAERHGVDAPRRLAEGGPGRRGRRRDHLGQHRRHLRQSWRVWCRFCAATGLPEFEGSRVPLVTFVVWMLLEGERCGQSRQR
jgi:hypothetical protein